jgi:hypothetical protein
MFVLQTAFVAVLCAAFTTSQAGEEPPVAPVPAVDDASLDEEIAGWLEAGLAPVDEPVVAAAVTPDELPPEGVIELGRQLKVRTLSGEGLWHFDTLIGTDFPLDIGGRFVLEAPARLRFLVGLGGLPEGYQALANQVIVAAGGYDAEVAALVDETLRAAFVLHAGLGVRPVKGKGFVLDVGYRMIMFTAQNTPTSVLSQVSNVAVPPSLSAFAGDELRMHSYVHQVSVRGGWEWLAAERLSIRFDVGGSFSLDTSHKLLSHAGSEVPRDAAAYIEEAERQLDQMFRRYGHTPTVGLSFGYRWF